MAVPSRIVVALVVIGIACVATLAFARSIGTVGPLTPSTLVVEGLRVSPSLASSPATVTVEGLVRNIGDRPLLAVSVGLSVAYPGPGRRWIPLQMQPLGTVASLQPQAGIPFRGAIRLEGVGRYSIGVVALSEEAVLPPSTKPVWILGPAYAATEIGGVFIAYAVLLATASIGVRVLAWGPAGFLIDPAPRATWAAVLFMALAPVIVWTGRAFAIRVIGPGAPVWIWAELPWIGALLFALGWMFAGAAIRPAGSPVRGIALAGLLYVVAGLVWTLALQITFGRQLLAILTNRDLLLFGFQWPLQIVQMIGLFSLGPS